jgi:hypothetical protein
VRADECSPAQFAVAHVLTHLVMAEQTPPRVPATNVDLFEAA